jgi:alpha-glucosidase (family GH31 glycosyl hydrolase)
MHLLPSIYSWTTQAILDHTTVMKHMMVAFNDEKYAHIDDQHMFGNLLIAPVLNPGQKQRAVVFPEGTWIHLLSNEANQGNQTHTFDVDLYDMLVFVRSGKALITQGDDLLSPITNDLDFKLLSINLYGEQGKDTFMINQKEVSITWRDQAYQLRNETNIQFKINFK